MRDDDVRSLREPPASIEAEQAVIGGLMLKNDALDLVDDKVSTADFYSSANRETYAIVRDLIIHGKPADAITVIESLTHADMLEAAGGRDYILSLLTNTPTAANIVHYARIVRDRAVRRKVAILGAELSELAWARDGRSAIDVLDDVTRRVANVTDFDDGDEPIAISTLLPGVVAAIEDRAAGGDVPGLSTGITDLDAMMMGLHPGELVLVAGEPGSGKTTLGMQFAFTAACDGVPGIVFSLEMTARALAERGVASVGMVPRGAMRNGRMQAEDWERVTHGIGKLTRAAPLFIDAAGAVTVERIRARSKRMKRKHGLGIVVVDYIQLMQASGDTANERVGTISRGLKNLAMELGVPVVALSQLNRARAQRTNKRPLTTDLRDSGSLEQDADVILFVYRDELHNPSEDVKGKAELIVGKQREGETGVCYATFLGQFNRFTNTEWRPSYENASRSPARRRADLD